MSTNPYKVYEEVQDLSIRERKEYQKEKTIQESLESRVYGQILLNIPRKLLKIGLFILICAAIRMAVLMKNHQKLDEFISSQEVLDFTQHEIHPLFAYMTKTLDAQTKAMISARRNGVDMIVPNFMIPEDMRNQSLHPWEKLNRFGRHQANDNSYIPGHVDHVDKQKMNSKSFYQKYLIKNKPVYVRKGCSDWSGIEKWKNGTYLRAHTMLTQSKNAMYDYDNKLNNYEKVTTQEDLENVANIASAGLSGIFNKTGGMPYLKNLWLNNNDLFQKDYEFPAFINDFLAIEDTWMSYTSTGTNKESKGKARQQGYESYYCVTKGIERFKFVSPIFKQNMYSGVREEIAPNKSPVDLFHDDMKQQFEKFPLLKETVVHDVTLRSGECLYIPAWWWMQSKTIGFKADKAMREGKTEQALPKGADKIMAGVLAGNTHYQDEDDEPQVAANMDIEIDSTKPEHIPFGHSGFRNLEEEIGTKKEESKDQDPRRQQYLKQRENDTLVIRMEFEPHSQMYDIINLGIELDLILDDNDGTDKLGHVMKGYEVDAADVAKNMKAQRDSGNEIPILMMPSVNGTTNSILGEASLGRAAERQKEMMEKLQNAQLFENLNKKKEIKPNPKEKSQKEPTQKELDLAMEKSLKAKELASKMSKKFEGKKQGWGPKGARDKKLGKAGGTKKPTNPFRISDTKEKDENGDRRM